MASERETENVAQELLDWFDRHGDTSTLVERLAVWLDAHHRSADVEALLDAYDAETADWDSHSRHRQLVSDLRALFVSERQR